MQLNEVSNLCNFSARRDKEFKTNRARAYRISVLAKNTRGLVDELLWSCNAERKKYIRDNILDNLHEIQNHSDKFVVYA